MPQRYNLGYRKKIYTILYKALIRYRLVYGCQIYNNASNVIKSKLDKVQWKALGICFGALRRTPVASLQVEAGEMPLQIRRDMLSMKYKVKLQAQPGHPANEVLLDTWHNYYCTNPKKYNTFASCTNELNLDTNVVEFQMLPIPPWHLLSKNQRYFITLVKWLKEFLLQYPW